MEGSNWAGARLGQGYDYMQRPPAQAARMMSIQAHALSENQSTRAPSESDFLEAHPVAFSNPGSLHPSQPPSARIAYESPRAPPGGFAPADQPHPALDESSGSAPGDWDVEQGRSRAARAPSGGPSAVTPDGPPPPPQELIASMGRALSRGIEASPSAGRDSVNRPPTPPGAPRAATPPQSSPAPPSSAARPATAPMRSPFAALSRERMGAPEVAADAEDAVAFQPRNVLRRSTDEHASPVRSPPPPRPSPAWGGAGAPDRVRAEGTGEEAREEPAPEAMSSPSPVRPSAPMSPPTGPRASPGVAADSRVVVESLDARARRLGLPMGLSAPASPPVSQPQLQPPQWLPRPIPPGADRGEAALLADAALRASWGSRSSLGDSRGGGRAVPGVGASWEGSWDGMAPLEVSSTVLPDGPQAWEEGSEPPPAGGPSEAGDASLSALPADTRFLPVPSGSGGGGGPEGGVGSQVRQSAPVRGGGGGELSRMYNSADYSTPVADRQGWGRQSQWARSPGGWDEESAGEALLRERQRREAAEAEARQALERVREAEVVLDGTRRQLEDTTALAKRMQGALRDVVAEKEELQTVVAKLQQREGMLKKHMGAMSGRGQELEREMESMAQAMRGREEEARSMQEALRRAEGEADALRERLRDAAGAVASREEALERAGEQRRKMEAYIDRLSQQNAELQRAASGLEAALTQAEERLTQERRHVDKLLRGHHALESRLAQARSAFEEESRASAARLAQARAAMEDLSRAGEREAWGRQSVEGEVARMRGDVARLLEDLAATRARLSQERTRSEELAQDLAQERARVGALEGRLSQERARGAALEGEVQRVRAGGGGDADMAAVLAEVVKRVVGDVTKGTREEGTREDRREGGQRLLSVEDLFAPSSSLDAATRRRRDAFMAFLSDSVAARVVDAFGPLPPARGPALIEASPPVPPRLVELPPPQADCPRGPDQRPGDGPSLQPSLEDSEPLGGPARAQRGRGGRSGEERGSGYGGEQRGIGYGGRDGGGRVQGESGGEVRGEEGERGAGMERQRGREVGSGGVAGREMGPAIEKATARRDEQRRAGGAEQGGEEAARGHAGGDSRWGYQVSKSVAGMSAPPAPPVQERARPTLRPDAFRGGAGPAGGPMPAQPTHARPQTAPAQKGQETGTGGGGLGGRAGKAGGGAVPGGGELMQQIEALEGELMELSIEKSSLETEYAKMPGGAGRTMKERQRKAEVEARLEELGREISKVRLSLKKLGVR